MGCQLKAENFPLFGGFASLNSPCKVQLVADAGWIKERKRRIHQSNCPALRWQSPGWTWSRRV